MKSIRKLKITKIQKFQILQKRNFPRNINHDYLNDQIIYQIWNIGRVSGEQASSNPLESLATFSLAYRYRRDPLRAFLYPSFPRHRTGGDRFFSIEGAPRVSRARGGEFFFIVSMDQHLYPPGGDGGYTSYDVRGWNAKFFRPSSHSPGPHRRGESQVKTLFLVFTKIILRKFYHVG